MRRAVVAALVAGLAVASAQAERLEQCATSQIDLSRMGEMLVAGRSFANNAIQIGVLDTGGEPACCSRHAVIILPQPDNGDACYLLSHTKQAGYREIDLTAVRSSYDPALGLLVDLPVGHYDPDTGGVDPGSRHRVSLRINQAKGTVVFEK
ncbi:hypothetical protein [Sedimentitalea nanhaiensis]|uniref:Uncharacterized protein n=1 Tax=Sedimentitalea nanhaiensis TaxID=999627 RepID=A0A1I7BMQ0_9RHOB|nr:hypothetical protein [Sedimentitalea nanhaiensis]SFT88425.1 hypothetical protein SAMN05216236_11130 [Sedimentitalea nanhaiensis]